MEETLVAVKFNEYCALFIATFEAKSGEALEEEYHNAARSVAGFAGNFQRALSCSRRKLFV